MIWKISGIYKNFCKQLNPIIKEQVSRSKPKRNRYNEETGDKSKNQIQQVEESVYTIWKNTIPL